MEKRREIRTSLEVGFTETDLPEGMRRYRGRVTRTIPVSAVFPFEDSQFEVVLLDGAAVSRASVKEAHRVLKANGELRFVVQERTKKQDGMSLPEIYAVVRDGFNIVEVVRPHWWFFGFRERTLTICARKKNWKTLRNTYRPYV